MMWWKQKKEPPRDYEAEARARETEEQAEADRLFEQIRAIPNYDPDRAVKVSAAMAGAGEMNIGVSLRLMLRILEEQQP